MKPTDLKVLFVDDVQSIRVRTRLQLSKLGILNFHEAVDGTDAYDQIVKALNNHQPFDLVFSDLNMQPMSGLELLKKIREHESPEIQRVRFIMITGTAENVSIAVSLGANQCLQKPYTEDQLGLRLVWVFGKEWEGQNFNPTSDFIV